ncbi:5-dehydro-4-deoxyglucarate dehydratase [Catenulispora pinisilvae]|uniref:5-dehydro-4-deoxyglucarate dehydratase n=1 Tax=Catenulispora pinisilvae TaxID=2705253 RepID=UPI0018920C48|nr:5-dehydro-4-deoxyglucarate dehydratase [Catenulispora pinisilvae]
MQSLVDRLDGLLYFPVTPFARTAASRPGRVDLDVYREHLRSRLAFLDAADRPGPAAVFACCGTGEFHSLDVQEYAECVRAAAEVAAGRVPVVAGIGYGAGLAATFAGAAKEAGADGLLVMPPYLVAGSAAGLREHYTTVAENTDLELIIYQRDNVTFSPDVVADLAEIPNIVGFKDGKGDLDLMQRIVSAVRDRHGEGKLHYFNGLPTAEMSQLAYAGVGVPNYSSAVFCFVPDIALAFYHAYRQGQTGVVNDLLDRFFRPLVELRAKAPGYAVALVKAGVRLDGLDAGPVRPPLTDAAPEHVERLAELIREGRRVLTEHGIGTAA